GKADSGARHREDGLYGCLVAASGLSGEWPLVEDRTGGIFGLIACGRRDSPDAIQLGKFGGLAEFLPACGQLVVSRSVVGAVVECDAQGLGRAGLVSLLQQREPEVVFESRRT